MVFTLFVAFAANLVLRLNDYVPGFAAFPVAEIMIPTLIVLWLFFEKKDFSLAPDVLVPVFMVVVVLGYTVMVWSTGLPEVARSLIPWVSLYYLGANLVRTPRRLDVLCAVLVICGLVLVAHGVQQTLNWDGETDESGYGWTGMTVLHGRVRYVGVLNDPNDMGLYLVMMLPLVLQLSTKGMKRIYVLLGFVLAGILVLGIYLTNSRGGMLASGVIATLYFQRRFGWMKAGIACTVLVMVALAFGPSRVREKNEAEDSSTQGRIDAWYTGLQVFKKYPVFGVGWNEFTPTYNPITAHNSFVLCFAETGALGYIAWLGSGYYALTGLYQISRRFQPGTRNWRQSLAMFDSLIAFYVGGFFLSRTYYIMLPLFIGLGMAQYKRVKRELDEAQEYAAEGIATPELIVEPDSKPLTDLRWRSMWKTMPGVLGLALLTLLWIYLVVKFRNYT